MSAFCFAAKLVGLCPIRVADHAMALVGKALFTPFGTFFGTYPITASAGTRRETVTHRMAPTQKRLPAFGTRARNMVGNTAQQRAQAYRLARDGEKPLQIIVTDEPLARNHGANSIRSITPIMYILCLLRPTVGQTWSSSKKVQPTKIWSPKI